MRDQSELIIAVSGKVAFAILGIWIVVWQRPFFFDESLYLDNVNLFLKYGWSQQFLLAYKGSAGPVYAVFQALLLPITGFNPWVIRVVNWLLLGVCVGVLYAIQKRESGLHWQSQWQVVLFPMIWVVTGMALTELLSLALCMISILAIYKSASQKQIIWQLLFVLLSALAMGLAIAGRQTYLLGLLAMPFLWRHVYGNYSVRLVWWMGLSLVPIAYLYSIWGGFTAPYDWQKYALLKRTFLWEHVLLAFGYLGLVEGLLSASKLPIYLLKWWLLFAGLLGIVWHPIVFTPLVNWVNRFGVETVWVTLLVNGLLFASACLWIGSMVVWLKETRISYIKIFCVIWIGLTAVACGAITHQFSSRYLVAALPFIGAIGSMSRTQSHLPLLRWLPLFLPIIGIFSLLGYYLFK